MLPPTSSTLFGAIQGFQGFQYLVLLPHFAHIPRWYGEKDVQVDVAVKICGCDVERVYRPFVDRCDRQEDT